MALGMVSLAERAYGPLVPYIREALSLNLAQVGILGSAITVGTLLATLPLGPVAERLDSRAALSASLILIGFSFFAIAVQRGYWGLAIALSIAGIVRIGAILLVNKATVERHKFEQWGAAMGLISAGAPLGGLLGAVVLPYLAENFGWEAGYWFLGLAAVFIGMLLWRMLSAGTTPSQSITRQHALRLLLDREVLLVCSGYALLVSTLYVTTSFLTLFLVDVVTVSAIEAGGYFALIQIAAIGGRVLWGLIADRYFVNNRSWTMALNGILSAASFLLLATMSAATPRWLILSGMVSIGLSISSSWGIQSAVLIDVVGKERAASSTAILLFIAGFSGVISPLVFGSLLDFTRSYQTVLIIFALVAMVAALIFAIYSHTKRSRLPASIAGVNQ